MIEIIGVILMVVGGINLVWFLLWALLAWSGTLGAKISKKVGTDNEHTDAAIKTGENFGKTAIKKFVTSAILLSIGAIMYYIIPNILV